MNESTSYSPPVSSPASSPASPTGGALAQPLELPCGVVLRNRIVKSAMSEGLGDFATGRPTPELVRLFERWGRSGAGMLITGNVMVDGRSLGEPGNVVIEGDRDLDMLEKWAAAARADGAKAIVQLNHPGRQTLPMLSELVVAPSAVRLKAPGIRFPMPRAFTGPEVEEQVERFATAAEVVVRAGFDGVQLHGAHGYLISQFLSPLANKRDDEWGGDPERRSRFLFEIVRVVRAAIGPERVLSVKLNSADFQRGGFDEDESLRVIAALETESIDLLEISGGTYERPAMMRRKHRPQKESTRAREAYFLEFAERARAAVELPLMVTGGLRSATGINEALAAGIDAVGMARPLCLEPDLPAALLADPATVSRLKPITTGIASLDGAAELFWGGIQLRRMGAGKEPNRRLGGRQALIRAAMRDGVDILRTRRVS